ncbi:MAG: response regulator [Cyanothece sp. SIO2G6]|nr:response regulator [Cyanothece sp. SIO2G6]
MGTVLLVEDSLTESEMITQCLQKNGLSVVLAQSSEEAQEKLAVRQPDLILLDIVLPGKSGFEFCRQLKKNPSTETIPVVMCSTKNTDADKMWGNMLGADAYLHKPIDQNLLVTTVQGLIKI